MNEVSDYIDGQAYYFGWASAFLFTVLLSEDTQIKKNFLINYKISGRDYQMIGYNTEIKEYNECIKELKGNLVMLDMYIRKKLKDEYPELFI